MGFIKIPIQMYVKLVILIVPDVLVPLSHNAMNVKRIIILLRMKQKDAQQIVQKVNTKILWL